MVRKAIAVKKYVVKLSADGRERLEALVYAAKRPGLRWPASARALPVSDRARQGRESVHEGGRSEGRPIASAPSSADIVSERANRGSVTCRRNARPSTGRGFFFSADDTPAVAIARGPSSNPFRLRMLV